MRVLVTGSAGFIGRRLVGTLARAGHDVGGLDKRDAPPESRLMAANYVCDLLHREALIRSVREFAPDAIVHLAARTDLEGARLGNYAANIEGVGHLIDAVRATPTVRRGIWTSSQLVCRVGYVPRHDQDYQPDSVYGRSKVRTEQIVRDSGGGDREWLLTRPTTIWGPGMGPHYQRLLRMIRSGSYFHVGRGPLLKSYGYVDNVAHQYLQLLTAPSALVQGRMFFVADYEPIDLIGWCNALQRALQASAIRTMPRGVARPVAWLGDAINVLGFQRFPFNSFRLRNILTQYQSDMKATEAICGPVPFTMEQGIDQTAAWFAGLDQAGRDTSPPAER